MASNISLLSEIHPTDLFKMFWESIPPQVIDNIIGPLSTLFKAVGIAFILYLIFVIIKSLWILKVLKRLKRVERKMNDTHVRIKQINEKLDMIGGKRFDKVNTKYLVKTKSEDFDEVEKNEKSEGVKTQKKGKNKKSN